jgi:gamma-glutamyl:cysteine ligase YbdK (ATP-grasp superfamily)
LSLNNREEISTYKPLEVLGPEHEYALVDKELKVLPISDKIIKNEYGRIVNFIELSKFSFGKEMQLHVMEVKANHPFYRAAEFEEEMHCAVLTLFGIVEKHGAMLLGTGMHPLLNLEDTGVWSHYHKKIYREYGRIFDLNQHGWLNIQSFHLNLPYQKNEDAVQIHNQLTNLCAYLPAIAASSPVVEGKIGRDLDNRLDFYKSNQSQIPSITGDVIPQYAFSLEQYKKDVIGRYSKDLINAGASRFLLYREWINSRGVIFRFDRRALEVRVMDEQECIKSDVALACFIRASLRGLIETNAELQPHDLLVHDFEAVLKKGLAAETTNPAGKTALQVCRRLFRIAMEHSTEDEKRYLWLVKKRIEEGSLSQIIRNRLIRRAEKSGLSEAIKNVYSSLINCLYDNEPYL